MGSIRPKSRVTSDNGEPPEFPKIVKAVMFFEFGSSVDDAKALDAVNEFMRGGTAQGESVLERCCLIDRNGKPTGIEMELMRLDPPVNVILNLAGTSDEPDYDATNRITRRRKKTAKKDSRTRSIRTQVNWEIKNGLRFG